MTPDVPSATIPVTALHDTGFWPIATFALCATVALMLVTIALYLRFGDNDWTNRVYWAAAFVPAVGVVAIGWSINASMTYNHDLIAKHYGVHVTTHQAACFTLMAEGSEGQCHVGKLDFESDDDTVTAYTSAGYPVGQRMTPSA